jgi:hypothetical protein
MFEEWWQSVGAKGLCIQENYNAINTIGRTFRIQSDIIPIFKRECVFKKAKVNFRLD